MINQLIIRRFLSLFLLLVFTCSVTPKKLLHDLVASHKDSTSTSRSCDEHQVSSAGYNCKCDNLVVESPFVHFFVAPTEYISAAYAVVYPHVNVSCPSIPRILSSLRGPPFSTELIS